ncbi:MAG TPA: 8-oxo-dGTP diphosphatase [Anaerolineales bacterium]|nr:8-oxo-dGTP diphosphatase [Anaerolineales bacterium]
MKLATLCYVRRAGQTLMVHRIKKANDMHMGKWNGMGGKLEPGETPEECAMREVFEETGLVVRNPLFKGMITFPAFSKEEDWYTFVFVMTEFEGQLIDSPEGTLAWIDNEHLLELNLWEGDRVFIPWLDQPGFFSAKFVYEDYEFVSHDEVFYFRDAEKA